MAKNEMNELAALHSALDTMDRVMAQVRAKAAELAERDAALRVEREKVQFAPEPLDDCIANAKRLVAEEHARGVKEWGRHIVHELGGGARAAQVTNVQTEHHVLKERVIEAGVRTVKPRLPRIEAKSSSGADVGLTLREACLLLPDLVAQGLERAMREAGAPHGLPAAARAKRLAEIDAELASIEVQHEELREGAKARGIEIDPLPEVQRRIAQEKSRALAQRGLAEARYSLA
jgi:hypothetical protein